MTNQQAVVKMFSFDKGIGNDVYVGDDSFAETYIDSKPNEGLQLTELTTLAKIEQKQESGKTVLVLETGSFALSKSTIEKINKVISSTKQKPVGEEASKQEQIEDFLKKYKSFNDVPVKDMRHIIPLLLMEVYVEKYGQYTKKVKGLWEKRPEDWDEHVPFVDPNNRLKNEGEKKNVKPKKELLGQMLTYLVDRYTKMKSAAEKSDHFLMLDNDPMLCFQNQPNMQYDDYGNYVLNLVETNDSELRAAEQSVSDQSLSTGHNSGYSSLPGYSFDLRQNVRSSLSSATNDGSMIRSSLSTLEDPLSAGMDAEHGELVEDGPGSFQSHWTKQMLPDMDAKPPEQVVDNEEETSSGKDWNPLEEICERTRLKLGYMKMKGLVQKPMHDQLESIHGALKNLLVSVLDDDEKLKVLDKWFELERCIETAKFQQPSSKCSKMIQDLHDELNPRMVPSIDFMDNNTVKSMSMGLPSLAEDPQQINSLLNIRPRPGPTGGPMVPFPHANQLEMRCLTTVTSGSNNGCGFSSLSENHKPIQLAQEDGESQKSDKPKDNLVTKDEFFPFCTDDELMEFLSQLNRQEDLSMPMEELSVPTEELSVPIQESAPATQSSSQLIGKLEIPADPNYHVMTGVSVQPFFGEYPAIVSFSPPTVASVQLMPSPPVSSQPSTAFAEECMKRLSLSVNPSPPPPPVQRPTPCIPPPNQPLLDELLRPRPSGRGPGGKRCYPFDEDDQPDKNVSGPSMPAKTPAFNTVIPLMVEEMSNNADKPSPRLLKRKTR